MQEIHELRSRISRLEERQRDARTVHGELREARNELALATAEMFVVVERAGVLQMLGVCKHTVSTFLGMRIRREDDSATITVSCEGGWFQVLLKVGASISLRVDSCDSYELPKDYWVRCFSSRESAEKHMVDWLQLHQ